MLSQRSVNGIWMVAIVPAAMACDYALAGIWKLNREILKEDLPAAIQTVKRTAKKVPIWLTLVAWSVLGTAAVIFLAGL
jgi:hypothetical protein